MENKQLIGKKVKGFKFGMEKFPDFLFPEQMYEYIGKLGTIIHYLKRFNSYIVEFEDGQKWRYPAELIEQHLVEEPQEPKYKIGDKVIVCGKLKTTIEGLQFSEKYQCYMYWFRDEHGRLDLEMESEIELLEESQEPKIIECIKDCNGNLVDINKSHFSDIEKQHRIMRELDEMRIIYSTETPTEGIKESDNKINIEYDWDFLKSQMNRMAKNKHKYPKNNWKKPMDIEQLKDALFRHVLEVMDNNFEDDGDEFGHLSAIALNAMMINYQLKNK